MFSKNRNLRLLKERKIFIMKKNKLLRSLVAFSLLLGFGLTACNGGGDDKSSASQQGSSSAAQEKITISAAEGKNKLLKGETVQLTASVAGVAWESKNAAVASVDQNGLVTALSKGSASISATKEGYKGGSINITVDLPSITITAPEDKSMLIGGNIQLSSNVQGVTWTSSAEAVATVDQTGKVTGVSYGKATITASKDDYNAASVEVSVVRPAPTAILHMEDAEHYAADGEWSSSNEPTEAPTYNKSNASDGTTCAHFGAGDMETIRFSASKAVKAEICLTIGYYYSLDDVSQILGVKFNGTAVTYPAQSYEAEDTSNYTYKPISFGELDLIAGTNALEITVLENSNSRFPYMDDLQIYAAEAVEITLVPAPQKDPVTLKQESLTVKVGKTVQIESDMTGLSYKSASEAVATVDENGLVTGVKVGTTAIAVSKDGYKTVRLPVTVTEAEGIIAVSIADIVGEGIATRTSRNLEAPYNYIIDEDSGGFPTGAVGTLKFTAETAGAYNMYVRCRASGGYNSSTTDDLATCMTVKVNGTVVAATGTVSGNSFTDYLLGEVSLIVGENTIEITCLTTVPTINMFRFLPKEAA